MERSLNELLALLKAAEENASLGIWEWDVNTGKVTLSKEAMLISCIDPAAFDGSFEYLANNIIHKDFRSRFEEAVQTALNDRKIVTMEYRLSCPDNLTKWVRVNGVYIFDDQGKPLKMTGVIQDISALKYYESELEKDSEFLDTLLEIIQNPIFYKNNEGKYQFCNTAFSNYLGIPKSEIIGSTVYDVAPSTLADVYHKADMELMQNKGHQVYEAQVKYADGTYHDVVFNKAVHTDSSGNVMGLVGVMLDITEQNRIKRQIADMNLLKEALIEINQNIVNYTSPKAMYEALLKKLVEVIEPAEGGCILEVRSESLITLTQCQGPKLNTVCKLADDLDVAEIMKYIDNGHRNAAILDEKEYKMIDSVLPPFVICNGQHVRSRLILPILYHDKLAHIITLATSKENAYNSNHLELANYVLEQTPIMYQVYTLYQKTLHLSQFDVLTNLMNRRHFEEIFEDRIKIAQREQTCLTLVTFDLDGLKKINDSFGHQAGDLYIKTFADYVSSQFRDSDRFARTGGDEFSALFFGGNIHMLMSKLRQIQLEFTELPMVYNKEVFYGSFSFGLASFPEEAADIPALEKLSDERMYRDKKHFKSHKKE